MVCLLFLSFLHTLHLKDNKIQSFQLVFVCRKISFMSLLKLQNILKYTEPAWLKLIYKWKISSKTRGNTVVHIEFK